MNVYDLLRILVARTGNEEGFRGPASEDTLYRIIEELEREGMLMSNVRMCDKCGRVFSVNEEGWQHFSGSSHSKDERGRPVTSDVEMDVCSLCIVTPVQFPARSAIVPGPDWQLPPEG